MVRWCQASVTWRLSSLNKRRSSVGQASISAAQASLKRRSSVAQVAVSSVAQACASYHVHHDPTDASHHWTVNARPPQHRSTTACGSHHWEPRGVPELGVAGDGIDGDVAEVVFRGAREEARARAGRLADLVSVRAHLQRARRRLVHRDEVLVQPARQVEVGLDQVVVPVWRSERGVRMGEGERRRQDSAASRAGTLCAPTAAGSGSGWVEDFE